MFTTNDEVCSMLQVDIHKTNFEVLIEEGKINVQKIQSEPQIVDINFGLGRD